jgi:hypothetical protein
VETRTQISFINLSNNAYFYISIWEINNSDGVKVTSKEDISKVTSGFFKYLYKVGLADDIRAQLKVLKEVPHYFNDVDNDEIKSQVTLQEIDHTISQLARDKSLGPDGWTKELFVHFFDIMGEDLLSAVEESRVSGKVSGAFNATFIALIPKVSPPQSFSNFSLLHYEILFIRSSLKS